MVLKDAYIKIPLSFEHLMSILFGGKNYHGHVGWVKKSEYKKDLLKIIKYIKKTIEVNIESDRYHENKLRSLLDLEKRIKSVEFGEVEKNEDCHEAEAIVFNFYDGSSMAIDIHSNAYNLKSEYGIPPNEVHTSLDILWDKPIKSKNG